MEEIEDAASDNSLPFGYGASAFGSDPGDEEDDFILDRPPLELRSSEPTTERYDVERAASPAPSYLSMASDDYFFEMSELDADEESASNATKIKLVRRDSSASSSCSFCSDEEGEGKCERKTRKKICSQPSVPPPIKPELVKDPNVKRHPAMTVEFVFKVLQTCLKKLPADDLKTFKRFLWERYPECFRDPLDHLDIVDVVDKMLEMCDIEVSLKITEIVLKDMKFKKVVEYLLGLCKRNEVRYELRETLRRKYENFYEGLTQQGQPTPFDSHYTDLYITEGGHATINGEHEYRQIETLEEGDRSNKDMVSCNNIFNPDIVKKKHLRTVITKGSPGIGKSCAVQKFIMDWVNGIAHQDVFFLLPLPFKEINQMAEATLTFKQLIFSLYPEMKDLDTLDFEDCRVMFICDGLEDCIIPIDFRRTQYWCDQNAEASVKILITNLIRGNMMYCAYVWVTTRPIAMNLIPPECIHQLLEVRGYTNEQKEAYFSKAVANKELAERMIAHIKSCKTLYIMCHMPLFCWVVRTVLEKDFKSLPAGKVLPKALTQCYTSLLLVHISMRRKKLQNCPRDESLPSDQDFIMRLAKMAFQLLEKNVFKIEQEHWSEYNLKDGDAVDTAGICTQFYRELFVMYQERVDCFIHPTVQEYLAALYVFLSLKNNGKNVLEGSKFKMFKDPSLVDLLKSAVDKALHDKNRSYDIFLRFLLGLSVDSNQLLLRGFLNNTTSSLQAREETARYIRKKIKENHYPDRNENLQMCLDELFPMP